MLEIVLLHFPMIKNLATDDYIGFLSCRLLCKLMIKLGTFGSLKAECDFTWFRCKQRFLCLILKGCSSFVLCHNQLQATTLGVT